MKKIGGDHRLKTLKYFLSKKNLAFCSSLLVLFCLCAVKPVCSMAFEKRYCASCHLDFQQMPLSSLRQKADLGGDLACPGLSAAYMEMDQIESWILSISRNLSTVKNLKNRERIQLSLYRISDYYRSQLSCEVASVSEIHEIMRKIQEQLDLKVFKKILIVNKRQDLLDLLGWFATFVVVLGVAYFIARKRRNQYDSTIDE